MSVPSIPGRGGLHRAAFVSAISLVAAAAPGIAKADIFFLDTGHEQFYTAPTSGVYEFRASSGSGGAFGAFLGGSYHNGGDGVSLRADVNLTAGQQLGVVVGGRGQSETLGGGAGGGGGTFIWTLGSSTPLVALGGGGGSSHDSNGSGGSLLLNGVDGGGAGGNHVFSSAGGGGGGGFQFNGSNGQGDTYFPEGLSYYIDPGFGGDAVLSGAAGGGPGRYDHDYQNPPSTLGDGAGGAFGGGGGASGELGYGGGGGGGGYGGGAGGDGWQGGYGGSSYLANVMTLTSPVLPNSGDGLVDITLISPVTSVPELSTWAMMLLGFGGLSLAASRRKAASAAGA
jgi:hypothetical protein